MRGYTSLLSDFPELIERMVQVTLTIGRIDYLGGDALGQRNKLCDTSEQPINVGLSYVGILLLLQWLSSYRRRRLRRNRKEPSMRVQDAF